MKTCNFCLKDMICYGYYLVNVKDVIFLCRRCLLYGVSQIQSEMVGNDPVDVKTCFNCGFRKKLDEFDEKKGVLKSWCRSCCENQSRKLKKVKKEKENLQKELF